MHCGTLTSDGEAIEDVVGEQSCSQAIHCELGAPKMHPPNIQAH
jgi:hypothetical protein